MQVYQRNLSWALAGKKLARAVERGCRSLLVGQQVSPDAKMSCYNSASFNPAATDHVSCEDLVTQLLL